MGSAAVPSTNALTTPFDRGQILSSLRIKSLACAGLHAGLDPSIHSILKERRARLLYSCTTIVSMSVLISKCRNMCIGCSPIYGSGWCVLCGVLGPFEILFTPARQPRGVIDEPRRNLWLDLVGAASEARRHARRASASKATYILVLRGAPDEARRAQAHINSNAAPAERLQDEHEHA